MGLMVQVQRRNENESDSIPSKEHKDEKGIVDSLREIVAKDRISRNRLNELLRDGSFILFLSQDDFEMIEDQSRYRLYMDPVLSDQGLLHSVYFWRSTK